MNVVIMRMMAETTLSSISVNPPLRTRLRGASLLKKERRSRYEEGGEGPLALHCISPAGNCECDAHSGPYPKRKHKRGKAGRNAEQPPQPQLKRAVAPAHPPAAGNSGDKKKRERQ